MFERLFGVFLAVGNLVMLGTTAPEFAAITILVLGIAAMAWPLADLFEVLA